MNDLEWMESARTVAAGYKPSQLLEPRLDNGSPGRYDSAMPVNMNPKKKKGQPETTPPAEAQATPSSAADQPKAFGDTTDRDKELALADAEWKNLWEATEVIDMDKW
ncbi:MAG TPA: hypothetical protein VFA38_07770 [Nitrospirales bacterium]|nr:hypothetical protein [Nitrospirales bacterium]